MKNNLIAARLGAALFLLCHAVASAHPGHYHPPGEQDEFDSLRADWLHLHGWWEVSLALTALISVAVFRMNRKRSIRVGAALIFGGSLALIAAR